MPSQTSLKSIKLGLIGDNIAASRAPDLHRIAGELTGVSVRYDRLVPEEMGLDFDAVFQQCAEGGYAGINITYPYKERAIGKVRVDDPLIGALGAVNTVLFTDRGPEGFNTDYSGFVAAYRAGFNDEPPGRVAVAGAGGVGRAVVFALVKLGVREIRLVDQDRDKVAAVISAVAGVAPECEINLFETPVAAADGADGVINCTPVGMVGYEGSVYPKSALESCHWAFDAVYTPVNTQFLGHAASAGLRIISGYELFFYQGIQAFSLFTRSAVDEGALRERLGAQAGPI